MFHKHTEPSTIVHIRAMVTYKVHQKQLSDTLQAQFIYEHSPVFAGTDDFSLLIRLRYTGNISDNHVQEHLNDPFSASNIAVDSQSIKVNSKVKNGLKNKDSTDQSIDPISTSVDQQTENSGWFGGRLSSQFSNATRNLFLNSFSGIQENDECSELNDEKSKLEKETLFLGYGQIFGHYLINDTIIDYSIFKDLQKSTVIEGKYAGIQGLDLPTDDTEYSLLSGFDDLYNTEINPVNGSNLEKNLKFIPFYSSNQNIIFSELEFDPNGWTSETRPYESVRSFYINCKLPKDLPPSYTTEAVQINYNFILGYQLMEGKNIISKTVFVPLKIQPFIDNYGRQPVFHLEKAKLNRYLEDLIIEDVSKHPGLIKQNERSSNQSRRISFWNLKKKLKSIHKRDGSFSITDELNRSQTAFSMTSLSSSLTFDGDVSNFLEILSSLDKADVNDIIEVQEQFEKRMSATKSYQFNVRENLMQILADYKHVQRQKLHADDFADDFDYDYLLPKEQQIKYIIKQNHGIISTLELNKGIFKLGDLINLDISFEDSKYETTGIEIQLLKHQVFHRKEYLKRGNYDEVSSRLDENILESILYEKVMSTFSTVSINTDIFIPLETEPQFKTNFFQSRYYVQVRFITIDNNSADKFKSTEATNTLEDNGTADQTDVEKSPKQHNYDMKNIFTDTNGSMLFRAKEHLLNANEFYIRVPVVILPTYEQDFGIFTAKV